MSQKKRYTEGCISNSRFTTPLPVVYRMVMVIIFFITASSSIAQQPDSLGLNNLSKDTTHKNVLALDTAVRKKFNPHIATIRSAIIPGWGQAYNKKYWKIPIVYGALGVSAGVFFFNLNTYKILKQAVIYRSDTIPSNNQLIPPEYAVLSTESLRFYRNAYRQNIDYSVLAFLLIWGLNVVDATVDAHLKGFDVGPDITLKIRPSFNLPGSPQGISLVLNFK
ncbi:MAG: hypothetical protein JSS98_06975 [Bacteroidetes bacterium]|nr:hypothetical protein [Bacteroidota bacterium]